MRRLNAVTLANLLGAAYLHLGTAERGLEHEHAVGHQLSVVLVGGHHVGDVTLLLGNVRQCAYHIVGFISRNFDSGDSVGLYDVLYIGNRQGYVLRLLVALRLVLGIGFVAECGAARVEAHRDV